MLTRVVFVCAIFVSLSSISVVAQSAPRITSLSPSVGPVQPAGGPVTIKGQNFGVQPGSSTVTLGGTSVSPTSWSDTTIVVSLPVSLPVGFLDVVVTVNGVSSSAQSFLLIPTILPGTPTQAAVGTAITITGTSFGDRQGTSTVTFNGTATAPTSWTNTSITAPVPIGAANGLLVVTVNGFQANAVPFFIVPKIGSFSPNTGPVATQVTIFGSGFGVSQGFGGVTFNSLSAAVQSWNDTSISVIIPTGATIGSDDVVVTASSLLAGSGVNFIVSPPQLVSLAITPADLTIAANNSQQFKATGTLSDGTTSDYTTTATWNSSNTSVTSISIASGSQGLAVMEVAGTANIMATVGTVSGSTAVTVQTPVVPNITGVSPSSGAPGTQVTITGSGFGTDQRGGSALLGSILGTIVSWSDGAVVAAVAPGSTSGGVQVLQNGLTSNRVSFTVNAPTVTSIAPTSGVPGSQVTISGSGFGTSPGSGKVWLGSTYGTVVTWDDTQITAVVAPSASSGKAQVMQGGTWSNSVGFSVNGPTISSLTPTNGLPGTQVTITGSGFGTSQGSGQVFLGTAPAIVTSWTDAGIQATVSQGSTTGTAQVLQNGALSNAFTFTVNIPQITTVSPSSGAVGTSVTISGSGFGESQGSGVVWIGSAPGNVTVWSDGQVQAMVAANAVSGIVKVEQNGIWSNALNFVVPQSAGTSVTLSPNLVSMVVGETRSLQAVDNTGTPVNGLSWTSSDTTLATLSNDDPPIITAVAPGHVTIIAGNASTDLTIYPDSLPLGTINWSVPGDSSGVINFIAAVPSDTGVADVFAHSGGGNIQAIRTDGSVAWTTNIGAPAPGLRLIPDFQGGLTFVKTDPAQPTQDTILRLDGTTGQSTTTYSFQNKIESEMLFTVDEPRRTRVFTDGTVVTVDGDAVIGIDPQTRASKFSIKLEHSTVSGPSGHCIGDNTNTDQFPALGSFIIAGDGYAYLVYQYSGFAVTPFGAYEVGHQEEHTRVLRVGPGGDSSKLAVNDWTDDWNARFFCPSGGLMSWAETHSGARASLVDSSFSVPPGGTGPLITNADQGVLLPMTLNWGGYFACESSNCFVSIPLSATHPLAIISSSGSVSQVATNIPDQIGWITPSLQAEDGTFFGQMDDSMIAFDQSGDPKWTVPGNFTPLMATTDGGLIARSSNGTSVTFDSSGRMTGPSWISGGVPSWTGAQYALATAGLSSFVFPSPSLAGTFAAISGGNHSGNNTAIQQVLTSQPQGPNDQLPPTDATLHATYHAIELLTNASLDSIFSKYIQTFQGGKGQNNDVMDTTVNTPTGTVTAVNQTLTFSLHGVARLGQGPFSVRINRFDPPSHTMVAVTLQGHPLEGWRYWRVFSVGTNDIVVETGAADRPHAGPLNYFGFYVLNGQLKVWQEFLQFIQRDLKVSQGSSPNYKFVQGTRNFDLNYILQNMCLNCP